MVAADGFSPAAPGVGQEVPAVGALQIKKTKKKQTTHTLVPADPMVSTDWRHAIFAPRTAASSPLGQRNKEKRVKAVKT